MVISGHRTVWTLVNDGSAAKAALQPGTVRRVLSYARPHWRRILLFVLATSVGSGIIIANPLLLKTIIDRGIGANNPSLVVGLSLVVAVLALLETGLSLVSRWLSASIGEGVIYRLRTQAFTHVQRMPLAFFTRTQTGSLISRLNTDVVGAQRAVTSVLQSLVANSVSVVAVLSAMLALSWPITTAALLVIPLFLLPARYLGRRLAQVHRTSMDVNAEMSSMMSERFNVGGATLLKMYGRHEESAEFAARAGRVRDIGVTRSVYSGMLFSVLGLITALATAMVYGAGGLLVVHDTFEVGTLVALATLLTRLYGPVTALSNVQVDVMTALVSFERVFEVLDMKPSVAEPENPVDLPAGGLSVEFSNVSFRYPGAEATLESLELVPQPEHSDSTQVLSDITFTVQPGQMVALVGPSGAGKTTITHLVSRLYDPTAGTSGSAAWTCAGAHPQSLRDAIGVVTQDAHLFHDTIRANLLYAARATEEELIEALRARRSGT